MKKYIATLTVTVAVFIGSSPMVLADPQPSSTTSRTNSHNLLSAPKRLAGVCFGVVVGTPICFMRKLPQELKEGAEGLAGSIVEDKGSANPFLIPAGLVWAPCAVLMTALEAPAYAFRDAYMAERPFSKESFSLSQLDPPTSN